MNDLGSLIDKIRQDKGLDLRGYKEPALVRRIERRIQFDGAESLDEYIQMIDENHRLYWRLVSDFFIGVTDFFRDKEIYDIVQDNILPEIIERRNRESLRLPIRIWSAGCSTGEETYSLAMMIKELYEKMNIKRLPAFVHGTDIIEDKLEIARQGVYPKEKIQKIEQSLIGKYFKPLCHCEPRRGEAIPERYTLNANLKYMTRFKKLDLTHPKGYAGFDMIVCRNVLIYFQRKLREKVLRYFHKALRPQGILWLGKSESLCGQAEMMFEPVFERERIFRKLYGYNI